MARELDISANTLHGWIKQYKQKNFTGIAKANSGSKKGERNLKKGDAFLRERPEVKYSFIHKNRFKFRVEKMCKVFNESRRCYHDWLSLPESERKKRRKRLAKWIKQIFLESRRLYGSPKITQVLRFEGKQFPRRR